MKNGLESDVRLNSSIDLDISEVPEQKKRAYILKFERRFNDNPYGFATFGGLIKGRKTMLFDVILLPRHILAFLNFERELRNEGYDVTFKREAQDA